MSWAEQRSRFPVLERFAYLNAGTFGPLARETLRAMNDLREWEGTHGRGGRAYFDAMLEGRERVRALLAREIDVQPAHVALTDSTTQGVQIVVVGLDLAAGDEVVTTDAEHFGLTGPLLGSGATLRIARVRDVPAADLFDVIRRELTPRTRLLALSAVSWIDGKVFPWRELARELGVPVLVDGAQAAGAIDVDATDADFYTVSAQKWLCGPDATGALYVREPEALRPRLVAYPSAARYDVAAGTWEPKEGAARFDATFAPASSVAGLQAALADLPDGRHARARELAERLRTQLAAAGHDVVTEAGQATLVSVRLGEASGDVVARLYDQGVVVRELPGTGLVRASVGWWNDESDLERLLDGLASMR
ncbi:MAG TPA: aminotransferase class V-fold PLP-dependent enzyme [Gaiellaceae bacterium]|nr:aminotransferase class V-fold PLP-dependent enzyme [Gaiellaceae bacterium]